MTLSQLFPLIITLIISLFGAWITIRISIAELKKDMIHLKEKLDLVNDTRNLDEKQSKEDMKELKCDMKKICESMTNMQIQMARIEARSEGKDQVIDELKNAVTTILKDRK